MERVDCWSGVNTESVGNHKEEEVLIGDYTEKTFKLWKDLWRDCAKKEFVLKIRAHWIRAINSLLQKTL